MLIVLTIFLLLLIPLAMVFFHAVRPRFGIQGFMVVLTALAGWVMVLLARSDAAQIITLITWQPASFFPNSPSMLVDQISWSFSIGLMSLTTAVTITSIAQLGQSLKVHPPIKTSPADASKSQEIDVPKQGVGESVAGRELGLSVNWRAWAGILVLTGFGLVAVTAGNMISLLLGWVAVDITELVILLSQVWQSQKRERIVVAFTARMAGIGMALLAGIIPWSQGLTLSFDSINQSTSIYLILAAGLRLGVLPIHQPPLQDVPLRRGLGTILRLIPAASSYILLARVAEVGVLGPATPYMLGLTALAGLYAGMNWLNARDELTGRPFWLLGTSTLAVASAILNQPQACLAWSMASILSGGLAFSMSIRHKNILPFAILGMLGFTALPFSPTWAGTSLYRYSIILSPVITPSIFYLLSFFFLVIHSLLMVGYARHILRGIFPAREYTSEHVERWVWFLYPIGLTFILVTQLFTSFLLQPKLDEVTRVGWGMGAGVVVISSIIGYFYFRFIGFVPADNQEQSPPAGSIFSLDWFYRFLWQIFRLLTQVTSLISTILEGDGGILWALVLFALIFVFLQR